MPYIPATIVVKFRNDIPKSQVQDFLKENKIDGVIVSDFVNRWALEVPPGREAEYSELFQKSTLIQTVSPNPIKGFKPVKREKNDETSHTDSKRPEDETGKGDRAGQSREHGISVSKDKSGKSKRMAGGLGKKN